MKLQLSVSSLRLKHVTLFRSFAMCNAADAAAAHVSPLSLLPLGWDTRGSAQGERDPIMDGEHPLNMWRYSPGEKIVDTRNMSGECYAPHPEKASSISARVTSTDN